MRRYLSDIILICLAVTSGCNRLSTASLALKNAAGLQEMRCSKLPAPPAHRQSTQ